VRVDDTWLYKYSNNGQTLDHYLPGVLDDVEIPLNNARGTNLAWVQWGNDPVEAMNDLSVDLVNKKTTGSGKYGFSTRQAALTTGAVWFNLEYVPFAVFDDDAWKTLAKNATAPLTARPVWVIRNGLNDAPQDGSTWTSPGITYNSADGKGGIVIGVVDPSAPRPAGLYEDNNPWPITGTSGKTSVEMRTWLNAYCAAQTPAITVTTLAGIHAAKGGDYTLLPRHYHAAPLTGKQPTGGITGTAAKNGSSWQDASSDIQKLVGLSQVNYELSAQPVEIWAAAGTYTASSGTGTVISITVANQYLGIYGGFKGTEISGSLPADRASWFNSYTTLAIDNKYGTVTDSARKTTIDANNIGTGVFSAAGIVDGAANFTLDGFTITHGTDSGLWIKDVPATALFTNLELTGNTTAPPPTTIGGGGIRVTNGAPRLDNLTAAGNTCSDWGAGMLIEGNSTALVTNARFSGNTATWSGGGIAVTGAPARLENIVVTGNQAHYNGGGVYNHGNPVIVNAVISGNTTDDLSTATSGSSGAAQGIGGAVYTTVGKMVLVNAVISGNNTGIIVGRDANTNFYGGGGVKVNNCELTLINCTVSGNYVYYKTPDTLLPGGGIYVITAVGYPDGVANPNVIVRAYNSLVLGNAGSDGLHNEVRADVATYNGGQFFAYNSLVGGYTAAQLNTTGLTDGGTCVGVGSGNVDGAAYSATAWDLLTKLNNGLFVKFTMLPTEANTGDTGYNAAAWDFRLGPGAPPGVVDGGDSAHFGLVSGGVSTDVAGAPRVQAGDPDMGAYESALVGAPIPTYAVYNAKPQSASTANDGSLTVNGATQIMIVAGAEVTIAATPVSGYAVGTITCRTASGVTVPVTAVSSTSGKFTMPAENVTVDATFTLGGGGGVNWGP
jgi:hypothetical protein